MAHVRVVSRAGTREGNDGPGGGMQCPVGFPPAPTCGGSPIHISVKRLRSGAGRSRLPAGRVGGGGPGQGSSQHQNWCLPVSAVHTAPCPLSEVLNASSC